MTNIKYAKKNEFKLGKSKYKKYEEKGLSLNCKIN